MVNYPPAIIAIKCSKIFPGQIGVFALRNIKRGTIIGKACYGGERLFSKEVYRRLDKITKKRVNSFCGMVYDGFFSIPNINYMPIHHQCNHGCNPNVGFDKYDNMILIKNVRVGSELLLDYGFVNTNPSFILHCKCGSKNCRKIITGNDWKNPEFSKKNKKYMAV